MMTGVIMPVIMGSSVLQWILSFESVPENLAAWMLATLHTDWAVVIGMNVLMIIVGTFLDLPAAVLLLAPIFLVVAPQIGLDTIQLGVIMVVNLAIGLYTPPVRTTLFVSVAIDRVAHGRCRQATAALLTGGAGRIGLGQLCTRCHGTAALRWFFR